MCVFHSFHYFYYNQFHKTLPKSSLYITLCVLPYLLKIYKILPKLKILETSIFFFFFSFPKFKKLNISLIYKAIIVILVSLPMVNIYNFCKREILIQPPGEPREQHLGDVRHKKFELHKINIKDKMTERVDILWRIFEKIAKKLKMKSQGQKDVVFGYII